MVLPKALIVPALASHLARWPQRTTKGTRAFEQWNFRIVQRRRAGLEFQVKCYKFFPQLLALPKPPPWLSSRLSELRVSPNPPPVPESDWSPNAPSSEFMGALGAD